MNKVIIKGNICNYLELRYTQSNIAILKFNVAVSRNFTKEDGTRESDFISCVAYKTTAENIQKYFDKGSGILVCGRIQTGNYEKKDGSKVYTTDVIVEEFDFIDKKGSQETTQKEVKEDKFDNAFEEFGKEHDDDLNMELPF